MDRRGTKNCGAGWRVKSASDDARRLRGRARAARTYLFDTYSGAGILKADRCDATLRTLDVVLMHQDYRARRVTLNKVRMSPQVAGDIGSVVIPLVLMEPY